MVFRKFLVPVFGKSFFNARREYGLLGCAALANHPSLRAIFTVFVDVYLEKKERILGREAVV